MSILKSALLLLVVMSTGCVAVGTPYERAADPSDDQALVYIYRPDDRAIWAIKSIFSINGEEVAQLYNGGYAVMYLSPGMYALRQEWKTTATSYKGLEQVIEREIDLAPGETYYWRFKVKTEFEETHRVTRWNLEQVPAVVAVPDLKKCAKQN